MKTSLSVSTVYCVLKEEAGKIHEQNKINRKLIISTETKYKFRIRILWDSNQQYNNLQSFIWFHTHCKGCIFQHYWSDCSHCLFYFFWHKQHTTLQSIFISSQKVSKHSSWWNDFSWTEMALAAERHEGSRNVPCTNKYFIFQQNR